ncbi:unnamed protein product [Cylindrotheca closterium]|uniref:Phospholipase/carboxylesterase/thioesterase domain-containing protein n=1 Tax=Cylindrotheca closterium TaxID=2856 RepID=A0AAD2JJ44_9STRA|nr:unnamed protein product [Cylindrotheca closterium]
MMMNNCTERCIIFFLWVGLVSLERCDAISEIDIQDLAKKSNARPNCDIGADSLAKYGGTRTCIESPTFEGRRCFFTIIPDCAGPDSPLVFDAHGLASCPSKTAELTRWKEMAQEHCFVLVYPLGTTDPEIADLTCWGLPGGAKDDFGDEAHSCCCSRRIRPVVTQDAAVFRQIAAVINRDVPIQTSNRVTIDAKRIYLAGHSNGCMAAISIAAQSSDIIAAVGCHAGSAITPFPGSYHATPMALVHGTNDRVVPYKGNFLFHSAETTHDIISKANECSSFKETKTEEFLGSNNTVTEFSSTGCKNNANVTLYAVEGAGHSPYLGVETFRRDEVPTNFDSTELLWNFVKNYELDTNPSLVDRTTGQSPISLPSLPDPFPELVLADEQKEQTRNGASAGHIISIFRSIIFVSVVTACHSIL